MLKAARSQPSGLTFGESARSPRVTSHAVTWQFIILAILKPPTPLACRQPIAQRQDVTGQEQGRRMANREQCVAVTE
jgi:hypothetical protein